MGNLKTIKRDKTLRKKYPSVIYLYDVAFKSYDWAIQRSDAVDSRIDRYLAWISSINIGLIAIIATKYSFISFQSFWFRFSMIMFIASIGCGIFTKLRGSLKLFDPEKVWEKRKIWFGLEEWKYKKRVFYWAGRHYHINQSFINWKGNCETAIIIIFLVEIISLCIWIIPFGKV
ncbi:MAG: hypothetical protein WAV76_12015 [Bacteroidota bacterium]